MNMRVLIGPEGGNECPDVSDDDPARSKLIDVTIIRKTCVDTGKSVLQSLSGHQFSDELRMLGDNIVRTQVSVKVFFLLCCSNEKDDIIRRIFISNP